jgi:hypothetical protein
MLKLLVVALCVASAFAQCPSTDAEDFSVARELKLGFRYDFETDKDLSTPGQLFVQLPDMDLTGMFLLLKFEPTSTTSELTDWVFKYNFTQYPTAAEARTDLDGCVSNKGSCRKAVSLTGQDGATFFFTLLPTCSTCRSTAEYAIEVIITDNSNTDTAWGYQVVPFMFQKRTVTFETKDDADEYVQFWYNFSSQAQVYFRIDVATVDSTVKTQFFVKNGSPATSTNMDAAYPALATRGGSYKFDSGLTVTAGSVYISVHTADSSTVAGFADWSVKAGLNVEPCDAAFSNSVSFLVLALAPLALLFNKLF